MREVPLPSVKSTTSLLKLNNRLFALSIGLLLLLSVISLYFIHSYHIEKVKQQHFAKQSLLLEERIDKKIKILHAATLVLANNSKIRDALIYEDRSVLIEEMGHLREQFGYWTGFVNYAFHVITHDGRSLYRNYEPESYGQDVTNHPLMRKSMADTSRSYTLIGKGGYGNVYRIINSQPVFALDDPRALAGFMTVSQGLKQIVKEFEEDGLEYYVFERLRDNLGNLSPTFVVDRAPYFSKQRQFSHWTFESSELSSEGLKLRDGWYYQTYPIYDTAESIAAFHLIMAPKNQISNLAWIQTFQVAFVLSLAILIVIGGGLLQLGLLRTSVLKPMRHLTSTLKEIINTERYDKQVDVIRHDEIGHVTQLFNQMLVKTDQLIFDLKYQKMAIDSTLIISRADKFGTITDVNDNFCAISGYTKEELIGQPHRIVRHPEMDSGVFKEMWATIQSKNVWQGEVRNRKKDGSSYYVMSYIIPILNRENEIQEYLSIREDITLIVELREGLQAALLQAEKDKQVAEKANQAKSEFLASMSHELRTPLNAVIGYAQLLELAKLEPKSLEQVETILRSSKHLLALINDILDFAKLESGKVKFNYEVLDVKELVSEVVQLTEAQAKQKGINIDVKSLACDISIEVDRLRFKQVLLNLLSNAVKYNRENGLVRVSCKQVELEQASYWKISVSDTGLGIREEDLDKIFEPFNRLGHESSVIQGSGIGLSITKDLVEQMHGWIEVDSDYGQGSTFSTYFPTVHSEGSRLDTQDEKSQKDLISKGVILYVGHDPKVMQELIDVSKNLDGFELKIAPTYKNGLEQAIQSKPVLVLVDEYLESVKTLEEEFQSHHIRIHYLKKEQTYKISELVHSLLFNPLHPVEIE